MIPVNKSSNIKTYYSFEIIFTSPRGEGAGIIGNFTGMPPPIHDLRHNLAGVTLISCRNQPIMEAIKAVCWSQPLVPWWEEGKQKPWIRHDWSPHPGQARGFHTDPHMQPAPPWHCLTQTDEYGSRERDRPRTKTIEWMFAMYVVQVLSHAPIFTRSFAVCLLVRYFNWPASKKCFVKVLMLNWMPI